MLLLLLATACGSPGSDTGVSGGPSSHLDSGLDCAATADLGWEGWAHGFFLTWCTSCHSATAPDRHGAPEGMDFDTEADVRSWEPAIRQSVLVDETMPLGGGLPAEERALLRAWLDCD